MGNNRAVVFQIDQQIFGPPSQRQNFTTGKVRTKPLRKRKTKISPPQFYGFNQCSFHGGRQAAPDCFNLWQFGHGHSSSCLSMRLYAL
ncbi:hypothetical protein D3C80_1892080 [compost metagenome]